MRYDEAVNWASHQFTASDTAKLDAELLLLDCIAQDNRSYLFTWPDKRLTDAQLTQFQGFVKRRVSGEPIAYILGYREFWSLKLAVSSDTLIPRPDTETLVDKALELIAQTPFEKKTLLDLGTGTGAIALALKSELPNWQIFATDFNQGAVALAKSNSRALELGIDVRHGSWFEPFQPSQSSFDLIVSNPPYIELNDPHLNQGDVKFEPDSALSSGVDGLDDIRLIIEQAKLYLAPGGYLLLEHGYDQAVSVQTIFAQFGYSHIASCQDLSGNDRITFAKLL
ncbi:peptide chain release factor N(5)-glutamine methyltransferase [Catenovulum sp. SM1970]|nr:peptide chain release factor N(5)-glutamine methyltransferase [Marinifaba aquimaris]